jgi:hypothetical protein
VLEQTVGVDIKQATVQRVLVEAGEIRGVVTDLGAQIRCGQL